MNKLKRVEQHVINKSNKIYETVDIYCFRSKNLYNYANYAIRSEYIKHGKWMRGYEIDKILQHTDMYKELGSQASQMTLQLLDQNWRSFMASIKDWSKNKTKYLGKPRMPKYLDKESGRYVLMLKNIQCKVIDDRIRFSWKPFRGYSPKTNTKGKLMQVRFIPRKNYYVMEIVYEVDTPSVNASSRNIAAIDLGLNNLASVSNNIGAQPFIINGKPLKSMNQYYNKKKGKMQSDLQKRNKMNWSNKLQNLSDKRFNMVKTYLHRSSRYILNWCIENQIDTLVVGKNIGWKQDISLGKRNNQNFVSIPYDMFINQLKYKCENVGIKFIETEESYTSGTSFLDGEFPVKEHYDKSRRFKRGLFKSNEGVKINADLNGSYQIMKKVFPNAFSNGIEDVGLHPVRVNLD